MAHAIPIDGPALRHLRKTRGHPSAASLAPHLGISAAQLYALESGRSGTTTDTYNRILTVFGLESPALRTDHACPTCGREVPNAA